MSIERAVSAPLETSTVAPAVITRGLRRRFGDRAVLTGIDLLIPTGEFVALLGASGTGKSTVLRALAGLDDGIEGEVFVPERRAVMFQDSRLLPWASVLDNVLLGLPSEDRSAALAALEEVGLAGHADAWPKTLSGGEAQRASIARALVRKPQLLLLDEPFGALDALTRIKMHALIIRLWRRHRPAVLLVTHDVDEALLLADRILVLRNGQISLDLTIEIASPRDRSDPTFTALRSTLLRELGVDLEVEGQHDSSEPSSPTSTITDVHPHKEHLR